MNDFDIILKPIPDDKFKLLSRKELLAVAKGEQSLRIQFQELAQQAIAQKEELRDKVTIIEGFLVRVKNKLFGRSSEKTRKDPAPPPSTRKQGKKRDFTNRKPSERYPKAPIVEKTLTLEEEPSCKCCDETMIPGMTDVSEYLTVIPKKFMIVRQVRQKYRCGKCHADIVTTPALPRIKPGSAYSDDMIIDAAMSKYLDLIPMQRYVAMAARQGFKGLPHNSLIEATHYLANFLNSTVKRIREEVLSEKVIQADETPHRMLEGDPKSGWYLWGFSSNKSCFFECRDTRSGDVASEVLVDSVCEVLLSDVFSGYRKAVRESNELRKQSGKPVIANAYCNAHARRYFKEAETTDKEASEYYLEQYRKIYRLESQAKSEGEKQSRKDMRDLFENMRRRAEADKSSYSNRSSIMRGINYLLKNYDGLTLFLTNPDVPIDNNAQERSLRSPVIGRKTWYGTHSKRGAETAASLFSVVETCKLNGVNPRKYLKDLVEQIHLGRSIFTPSEYKTWTKPP